MIGENISHYKILEKIGEGGMGVVYKAHDTKLDRFVALKFLPPHLSKTESDKARFLREAKAAAALNHNNVCTIHEIHDEEENPFIVMEYVEGKTLKDIIKELEKPGLDPREVAKVFTFNKDIRTISDLDEGQLLPGIVNNITNFGCFVDVGIKESGLVHVSNLSDKFVSDVSEIVHLHQQVIVKVLDVDIARKRIQLTMNYK